jgi:hypothetical protein
MTCSIRKMSARLIAGALLVLLGAVSHAAGVLDTDAGFDARTSTAADGSASASTDGTSASIEAHGDESANADRNPLTASALTAVNGSSRAAADTGSDLPSKAQDSAGDLQARAEDTGAELQDQAESTAAAALDAGESVGEDVQQSVESSVSGEVAADVSAAVQDDVRTTIQEDIVTDVTHSLPLPGSE